MKRTMPDNRRRVRVKRTFSLDPDISEALNREAARRAISNSGLVNRILGFVLNIDRITERPTPAGLEEERG